MKIEFTVCDRCGTSMGEGTGAIVMRHGGYDIMHMCDKCCGEVFSKSAEEIAMVAKGVVNGN